jgi:hypothetical protein
VSSAPHQRVSPSGSAPQNRLVSGSSSDLAHAVQTWASAGWETVSVVVVADGLWRVHLRPRE